MITSERQRMRISHVAARPSVERVIGKTVAQAFAALGERGRTVAMPGQNLAMVSDIIPTHRWRSA